MRQELTALLTRLRAASRWSVRHWSSVWPPLLVALVIALGAAFIYMVPMQLVHRDNASDVDSLTKARHDERATLLQSLVGLLALFGAVSALRQLRVTREGQITDRYTKAIDQLDASKAIAVRLGWPYALERIARDSPADRATIAEVLCAYARTADRDPPTRLVPDPPEAPPGADPRAIPRETNLTRPVKIRNPLKPYEVVVVPLGVRAPDVQAAITILGRWRVRLSEAPPAMDLHDAELQGANLSGTELGPVNLSGAQLQKANLSGAQLERANLSRAQLQQANLSGAQLQSAILRSAKLSGADCSDTKLQGADLSSADLAWAGLPRAELQGANLFAAELQEAVLKGAKLQGAKLRLAQLQRAVMVHAKLKGATLAKAALWGANLTGADLQEADLSGAELKGAILHDARLQGTHFSRPNDILGQVDGEIVTRSLGTTNARADSQTVWPDGFDWKAAGVELEGDQLPPATPPPDP